MNYNFLEIHVKLIHVKNIMLFYKDKFVSYY